MKFISTLLVTTLTLFSAASHAVLLDFNPNSACGSFMCVDGSSISQSYGDTVGVDVQWSTGSGHPVEYWSTGYTGLNDVAYAAPGSGSGPLIIELLALGGSMITLNSFDLGDYFNRNRWTQWSVYEVGGPVLASSGSFQMNGSIVSVNGLWSSGLGIGISLGPDAWDVGIDNINFDVKLNSVSEPASFLLLALGMVGIGFTRKTIKS